VRSMSRFVFFLSGKHSTLPSSEAMASVEALGENYNFVEKLDQVLVLESDAKALDLSRRLGMCHWIGEHFCICSLDNLFDCIGSSDLVDFLPQSKTLAVRVKRVGNHFPEVDTQSLAKQVADLLMEEYDYEIDLENPDNEIKLILSEEKCVVSLLRRKVDREIFSERKPPERSEVHPSTMQPNLARSLVNLARTPEGGSFLDPFCGVGGILIEAGLVGAEVIGVDINSELIEGARNNLESENITNYDLRKGDARELDVKRVDAIATDPPYGRQASTGGSELGELYRQTLPKLAAVLKTGKFLCITSPERIDLEEISKDLPLTLKEKHKQRVHRSLTRNIYTFIKRERV